MYELNDGVVFVEGACNGALYDFNSEKVYAINSVGVNILKHYAEEGVSSLEEKDLTYVKTLENMGLLSQGFRPSLFKVPVLRDIRFDFVWLELTANCNMRCVHCYEGNVHRKLERELTFDQWKKVIDELKEVGCPSLIFIGGEPVLNKNLKALIEYAATLNFSKITVFTNATLVTDELMEAFKKHNVQIRFSLYGHTAEVHERVTKIAGSFDKTMKNIRKMREMGIELSPAVIIMKENEDHVQEIRQFIEELGIPYKNYDVIRNVCNGTQCNHEVTRKDVLAPVYRTEPLFKTSQTRFITTGNRNTCWFGKFAVAPNGDVFPCEFEREIKYGNVLEQSIKCILDGNAFREGWFLDFSKVNVCKDCEFRYACKDCRPLGKSTSGDVYGKNPRCLYDPYTGIWKSL